MTCVHLKKLYALCEENSIRLSSADLVHVVCTECGRKEVCPSMLLDEYEWDEPENDAQSTESTPVPGKASELP